MDLLYWDQGRCLSGVYNPSHSMVRGSQATLFLVKSFTIPFERLMIKELHSYKSTTKEKIMKTSLECIEENAAGIDVGSFSHFVAVPAGRDEKCVKRI